MSDHTFDMYFLKLAQLEEQSLKRRKIEPQEFMPTTVLPAKVVDVLCDVYKRVVYVTRVMLYMYQEQCIEFRSEAVDHILGTVRVVPPQEALCTVQPVVCMETDTFFLHLSSALQPLAVQNDFFATEIEVCCSAIKTTSGGKSLLLLTKMSHLTEKWARNMQAVLTLMQADVAYSCATVYADEYDEKEGVVMPRKGFRDDLQVAVQRVLHDKPLLQREMHNLRQEFKATKCTFAKPAVAWISEVWRLKMYKYRHLPNWEKKQK